MGYIFGNQCGVMTVNDERTVGQPKEIRFINSGYGNLGRFRESIFDSSLYILNRR